MIQLYPRSAFRFWSAALGAVCLSAAVPACGSDDEKKQDLSPFLGAWVINQGAVDVTCQGFSPPATTVSGNVTIKEGSGSDLVLSFSDAALSGCLVAMNVKNGVASPVPGQSCTFTFQGTSGTFAVNAGTLTVTPPTGNVNLVGTASVALGNLPITCNGTVKGGLSALAVDAGAGDGG
ncbi:MAG: hypothetical protein KA712_10890 [Myxococcales bacterium]|nr:hypothetical protein [Myxococcales bacterium]